MSEAYQHAVAPSVYKMTVLPLTGAPNLDTVTAASFKVLRPDATTVTTWTASVVINGAGSSATLTLSHTFVVADIDVSGNYKIYADLTVPAGTIRTATATLRCIPRFGSPDVVPVAIVSDTVRVLV